MFKDFLRTWLLGIDHVHEVEWLKRELSATKQKLADVRADLVARDEDVKELMDRFLYMNGVETLHNYAPAKKERPKHDPLKNVSQARDFSRLATADLADLERQALGDTEFTRRAD